MSAMDGPKPRTEPPWPAGLPQGSSWRPHGAMWALIGLAAAVAAATAAAGWSPEVARVAAGLLLLACLGICVGAVVAAERASRGRRVRSGQAAPIGGPRKGGDVMSWFSRLVVVAVIGLGVVLAVAVALPSPRPAVPGSISHDVLEQDRVMTQRMSVDVGPQMNAIMEGDSMLQRSADSGYVRALEWHAYELDRMIGRVP